LFLVKWKEVLLFRKQSKFKTFFNYKIPLLENKNLKKAYFTKYWSKMLYYRVRSVLVQMGLFSGRRKYI